MVVELVAFVVEERIVIGLPQITIKGRIHPKQVRSRLDFSLMGCNRPDF